MVDIKTQNPEFKPVYLTVGDVVYSLRELESKIGQEFERNDFEQAIDAGQKILEKLGQKWNRSQFLDKSDLREIIGVLEKQGENTVIDELVKKGEETVEEIVMKPESKLDKLTLDELVEEYERATETKKEVVAKKIYQRTGKKNVDQFIKRLKELSQKAETKVTEVLPENTPEDEKGAIVNEVKTATRKGYVTGKINEKEVIGEIKRLVNGDRELAKKLVRGAEEVVAGERVVEKCEQRVSEILPKNIPEDQLNKIVDMTKGVLFEKLWTDEDKRSGRKIIVEIKRLVNGDKELVNKLIRGVEEVAARERVEKFANDLGERVAEKISDNSEVQTKIVKIFRERVERVVVTAEDSDIFRVREVEGKPMGLAMEIEKSVKVGAEAGGMAPVLEQAKQEVDNFLEKRVRLVDRARSGAMKERLETEMVRNLGGKEAITPEQREAIENYKTIVDRIFFDRKEGMDIEPYRQVSEATAIDRGIEPSRVENSWHELRGVMGILRTKPKEFNKMVELYKKGNKLIGDKLPNIPEIKVTEKLMQLVAKNQALLNVVNFTQRFVALTDGINGIGGKILIKLGADKLGWSVVEKVGGQAGVTFAKEALTIIGKEGLEKGVMTILKGILSGGVKATGAAAEGTAAAGAGGGLTALVAAFQALPVVGQVILVLALVAAAAVVVWKTIIAPVLNGVKDFLQKNFNINLNRVKSFVAQDLGLGKFAGSVAQFGFDVGFFLVGLPALLATINFTAIIAPVFIFFMVGIMGYSLLQGNMISSLVPPPPMGGGNCILKSDVIGVMGEGTANCDINAPESPPIGIDKETFGGIADRWFSQSNSARDCFNDVVNRSLCAGINPLYSLMMWLHESGASNYSMNQNGPVEDFGIHLATVPPENFNEQINWFLKLDSGAHCLNDPKIAGNYWLGWATNMLNGSCNPDEANSFNGLTGRQVLPDFLATWQMLAGGGTPLPTTIHVSSGGQNCGSAGTNTNGGATQEFTDGNGKVWVCTTGSNIEAPSFTPWDPSIPVPEGCPGGMPISGVITQGPFANGCTHQGMTIPAVDIANGNGTEIRATHSGVAEIGYTDIGGFYVIIHGTCEGSSFVSYYGHMPEGGQRVASNQQVNAGDVIGVVNSTGNSTGPHVHYQIQGLDVNKFGQYLGLTVTQSEQLWGCCGSWNGKACP
jgi:hypothetical protein